VADYAAQALISKLIFSHFPSYRLVGEEDSKDLRSEAQSGLRSKITELANWALALPSDNASDDPWSAIGSGAQDEGVWLDAIDKGDAAETSSGRVWALDPIDGTKGFLRQGQYAVCLALLEDGKPVLGVMGCPNLPVTIGDAKGEKGVLFVAVKGEGAFKVRSNSSKELL
jgi:3'(2'), 5'-bisphosphate nucleotidase